MKVVDGAFGEAVSAVVIPMIHLPANTVGLYINATFNDTLMCLMVINNYFAYRIPFIRWKCG